MPCKFAENSDLPRTVDVVCGAGGSRLEAASCFLNTMGAKGSKSKDKDKGGKGGAKISQSDMAIVSRPPCTLKQG